MGNRNFSQKEKKKQKKGSAKIKTDTIIEPTVSVEVIKRGKKEEEFE